MPYSFLGSNIQDNVRSDGFDVPERLDRSAIAFMVQHCRRISEGHCFLSGGVYNFLL